MFWLAQIVHNHAREFTVKLEVWLGMVLNYGNWIDGANEDPVNIPILITNKSARNVLGTHAVHLRPCRALVVFVGVVGRRNVEPCRAGSSLRSARVCGDRGPWRKAPI